ncbi:uncharacterized protein [Chelonus insularis]|uniref:uncharacterized protein n=1 Tax=Chelonus insularis TaxID=460826 RepID=UPI00158AC96F|nr:uncharacterized protein LOC118070184 [Chelonus insularis]
MNCYASKPSSEMTFSLHFSINHESPYCVEGLSLSIYVKLMNSNKDARKFAMDLMKENKIPKSVNEHIIIIIFFILTVNESLMMMMKKKSKIDSLRPSCPILLIFTQFYKLV